MITAALKRLDERLDGRPVVPGDVGYVDVLIDEGPASSGTPTRPHKLPCRTALKDADHPDNTLNQKITPINTKDK